MGRNCLNILLLLSILLLGSCGYLSDDPPQDTVDLNEVQECTLDPDALSQILVENLDQQLDCLEKSFNKFIRYVRQTDPNRVDRSDIDAFVNRFFAKSSRSILQAVDLVFEFNMLILRDPDRRTVLRDNVKPLFKLLILANREAVVISKTLEKLDDPQYASEFWELRKELNKSFSRLSQSTLEIISKIRSKKTKINLESFFEIVNSNIPNAEDKFTEGEIKAFKLLKRVLLGGSEDDIDSDEVLVLLHKMPGLTQAAFDIVFVKEEHFSNKTELYNFYQQKVDEFKSLMSQLDDQTKLFNNNDLLMIAQSLLPNTNIKDQNFLAIAKSAKKDLLGGDQDWYNFKDLKSALIYVKIALEGLTKKETIDDIINRLPPTPNKSLYGNVYLAKQDFLKLMAQLAPEIRKIIGDAKVFPQTMNIYSFAKTLSENLDDFKNHFTTIDAFLSVKRLLLGGDKKTLTPHEIDILLDQLVGMGELYFDLSHTINYLPTDDNQALYQFLLQKVENIETLVAERNLKEISLSINDVESLLSYLFEKDEAYKYVNIVKSFKYHVIGGGHQDTFTFQDIKTTFNIAKIGLMGLDFMDYHKSFMDKINEGDFLFKRSLYYSKLDTFKRTLQRLLQKHADVPEVITFLPFLEKLKENLDDFDFNLEDLKTMLPLKVMFVGGDRTRLTKQDLDRVLNIGPDLLMHLVDFTYYKPERFEKESDFLAFVLSRFTDIEGQLYPWPKEKYFFDTEELVKMVNLFVEDEIKALEPTLEKVKEKFIWGDPNRYERKDIDRIIDLALEALEIYYFNDVTYEYYRRELEVNRPISYLAIGQLPEYRYIRSRRVRPLQLDFVTLAQKYRYFRESFNDPQYYGKEIRRTKYAFKEIGLIEWALKKVFKVYGHRDPNDSSRNVGSIKELETLFWDFKPLLEAYDLWSPNIDTFGRNTVLMADLFQNQSNGDMNIGLEEATEYASMVFSSLSITHEFMQRMQRYCTNLGDSDDIKFDIKCYRKSYFQVLLTDLKFRDKFPRLKKYYADAPKAELDDFLVNVEGFARDVPDDKIPMNQRDMNMLIGAMINIETALIRFDKNDNNVVDRDELNEAFVIYRNAIIEVAELEAGQEKYAESIFLYMVKYMKKPSKTQLLTFHYAPTWPYDVYGKNKIVAKRQNIGTLLYYLVVE